MELKFVVPNMAQTLETWNLQAELKSVEQRVNDRMTVVSRSYNLYSDV